MDRRTVNWAKVGALIIALGSLPGCLKTEKFPVEPNIAVKSVEYVTNDSLVVTISFTDGDGDIGLDESFSDPPFDEGSFYFHNLFYDVDTVKNGVWASASQPYYYRVKVLTPSGQNKALDGEIAIGLSSAIFPVPPLNGGDSCRFRIKLVDRALHESNQVTTDGFVLR